jgi:hypothetical protein
MNEEDKRKLDFLFDDMENAATAINYREAKAAILAAFAELRQERDALSSALQGLRKITDGTVTLAKIQDDELARLRQERDAALDALRAVEWVWDNIDAYQCPWCQVICGPVELEHMGHQPDCLRQRALGVKP